MPEQLLNNPQIAFTLEDQCQFSPAKEVAVESGAMAKLCHPAAKALDCSQCLRDRLDCFC